MAFTSIDTQQSRPRPAAVEASVDASVESTVDGSADRLGAPVETSVEAAVGASADRLGVVVRAFVADMGQLDLSRLDAPRLADGLRQVTRAQGMLSELKGRLLRAAEKAEVDRDDGAVDMVAWARTELGDSGRAAKRDLELGRGLERLPQTAAALSRGEVGVEQAEQLARAARTGLLGMPTDVEDALLPLARSATPEALRTEVRRREAAADADRLLHEENYAYRRRQVRHWQRPDGMYEGRWLLDAVSGEYVTTMLQAFSRPDPAGTPPALQRTPDQQRADALVQAAKAALDAADAPVAGGQQPHISVLIPYESLVEQHRADCDGRLPLGVGGSGDIAGCGCLDPAEAEGVGPISRDAFERLLCDSSITRIVSKGSSQVLDVGRATRNWSGPQRRAIVGLDGGCRFPTCDRPAAWTNVHHIHYWRNLGPTNVTNGVLLCVRHYRLVHEGGWTLTMDATTRQVRVRSDNKRTALTSEPRGIIPRRAATRQPA